MPLILDTAYYRYTSETDLNQALICLSNLRESEYMDQVSLFLEATYEAALEGKFQDSYPYPSFAPINRNILYGLLCGKPELAKNEFWEGRRECIESLISKTETVINENGMPSKELYVFASDSQVMAIAVHDIYPMAENDDVEFTDDNQERLKSQEYYEKFLQLYKAALSNRENIEAKAILNNEMLAETVNHYLEIDIAIADSQSRLGTQVCIIGLIALLGFLSTWLLNAWPWYWSVLIGVVAAVITFIIMPISRVFEDRNDKLIRIEKSIQNDSLNRGGEVKMIDLASLEKNTTRPWKGALIGALLGLFIPPFFLMGALAWGAVGFILVLIFGGEKDQEDVDYSYGHIKVGPSLKMRIFMYFLIACCIGVVVYYFINKNTEKKRVLNEDVVEVVDSNDEFEVVEEISEPITETVSIESSEETDEQLIRTIYDKFVFGFSDENPNSYFTPKAIKSLQDAYDYDCPDNDCYGYWELRTGTQDGPSNECGITSIESQGNGWFIVSYKDMGLSGKTRIKVVDHKIDDYESSGVL